ncbi:hypothetical protein HPB52_003820 [Rhipicephalus sanguineus]|uniref:MD-2-related lipid-recognition domain-containing protein n=1 Tax=Rhipicephalus sanguineus TaxID=34632 RepID=A0A9D4T1C9_RHISA|nr:hypothetical protein HPB52_003820 [Rhipicephalus sanguineus]
MSFADSAKVTHPFTGGLRNHPYGQILYRRFYLLLILSSLPEVGKRGGCASVGATIVCDTDVYRRRRSRRVRSALHEISASHSRGHRTRSPFGYRQEGWLLAFQKWGDSVRKYSVRNCGSRYDAVQYEELRLRPDPLSFPGSVFVTSAIKVSRNVTAPIKVNIIMKKKVYLWVTVPCVNDFGSCDYDDICDVQDCPLFYDFLGLPCGCPIKEGDYSVRNKEFEVPALLLPDWITSGDYQVTVKARSRSEPLFCVHFTLSLK